MEKWKSFSYFARYCIYKADQISIRNILEKMYFYKSIT